MKQYPSLPTLSQSPNILVGAYVLTSRPSSDWPELQFYFDGVIVSIPPSVYFVSHLQGWQRSVVVWNSIVCWICILFYFSFPQYVILGDTFMTGLHIIHNRAEGTIGFAMPSSHVFVYLLVTSVDGRYRTKFCLSNFLQTLYAFNSVYSRYSYNCYNCHRYPIVQIPRNNYEQKTLQMSHLEATSKTQCYSR